jgi:sugar phosphate isomerase/epimerase
MRFRHPDGSTVHLAYGTNVHPAETVDGQVAPAERYGGPVRAALGTDVLGMGLWLPAAAAADLASSPRRAEELRRALRHQGIEVVTVNAFPYRGFHDPVVKKAVYRPDWTEQARLDYTLACARVLATLLPDDADHGSISTLPLGWRAPWYDDRDAVAARHLDRLDEELGKLAAEVGRPVRVGLEPEPGCVVETSADAVRRLGGAEREHVGVCVDTCHLATQFEDTGDALDRLERAGLEVVKAQASAALHAERPDDPATRRALAEYAEDRFLHQVRERAGDRVSSRDDLGEALDGGRPLPARRPWRIHFHVPVHARLAPPLSSTTDHLVASLAALVGGPSPRTRHVEVETYTWGVLPPDRRPRDDHGLVAGLAGELAWVRDRLLELGLEAA